MLLCSAIVMACLAADPPEPRVEFTAIADRLASGGNAIVGTGQLARRRAALATMDDELPVNKKMELHVGLVLELLKHGQVDEASDVMDRAFEIAAATDGTLDTLPFMYRARALVNMRRAEVANCIANHNADCCIFPLAGGGVHGQAGPARRAYEDYVTYAQKYPNDLGVRWLLNIAAMAAEVAVDEIPLAHRIPRDVFESDGTVGRFLDVAAELGIDTFDRCGGAIVDDFDGDGDLDLVSSTFDPRGAMTYYRNAGADTFVDESVASRLDQQLGGLNCINGDYDGDGDVDILVLRGAWLFDDGRIRNSLLRNDGRGVFTDVTYEAGLAEPLAPTQAAAWGDFDLDGDLDLYIGNESRLESGDPAGNYPSQLFRNDGDGTFTDVAEAAGVTNDRYCKGVSVGDYDNDGDPDIYVSNFGANRLYRNMGDWTFVDVGPELGVTGPMRGFAAWFFDYDNDGWLDIFATAYEAPIAAVAADHLGIGYRAAHPALYRNTSKSGTISFANVTEAVGLDHAYLPMGAGFGDVDGDGWLDIYLATGDPNYESLMPNVLLRNAEGQRFEDVTTVSGLGHLQKGHGVAFADIDDDGDQDLFHQLGGFYPGDGFRNALFRNPGHGGRHLVLHFEGRATTRSGYGARVSVIVEDEDGSRRRIHRAVGSVSSFGNLPHRLEIGLGQAERIVRLEVWWPASGIAMFADVPLDATALVVEGRDTLILNP